MNLKLLAQVITAGVLLTSTLAAQSYQAIDLGDLPGQQGSVAMDINNRGQVVGVSGGEAFVWELGTGMRPLGTTASTLRINNAGVIAGIRFVNGFSQLFAWVDGVVHNLPSPPGENLWLLRTLTDNGILLVCGSKCWGLYGGALYDLEAITGASIFAVNEAGTLGGMAGNDAYLRYWDGRVLIPWRGATFPDVPGPGSVDLIGPGGHFVGHSGQFAWYGMPDGTAFQTGLGTPVRGGYSLRDINRRGDVVGMLRAHILLPQLDTAFLFADGRLMNLKDAVVSGPSEIRDAVAINDDRYIVGAATVADVRRAVVLVPVVPTSPTGLSFTVSGNVVTLSWTASTGAQDYILEAGSAAGARDLYNASVGALTTVVTPAPPGRYYVRVRARNTTGSSSPSNEVIVDVR